ncbi:MAG TPA: phosphoribosyltransferase family protein [Acidimicrobiales bacterium]|nr:phosphoribosyltransferase family protein [Acidimicrobiales bacterium]
MLLGPNACVLCGAPGPPLCRQCVAGAPAPVSAPPLHLDSCVALLDYRLSRPVVTSLKNGQRRALVGPLADALAARARPPAGAVITWAPTTPERIRRRGFDQAELLARALARRWNLPCRGFLRRVPGAAQAGRGAAARRANPAFHARGAVAPAVVVVDDVVTTGATLGAAAQVLRAAGATSVQAVVVARA